VTALRLVLASQSPARLATLRAAGLDPEVVVSGVDESTVVTSDPEQLSIELARLKARAVSASLPGLEPASGARSDGTTLVVGCDSVLEIDGSVHGKPGTVEEATHRWHSMRGSSGVLHTGHCVIDTTAGREVTRGARTVVHFADLSDAEIEAYVATGEPLQVAGAFTIDGLGGAYVTGIEGDPHTVVGISLPLLRSVLGELGYPWHELWRDGPGRTEQPASGLPSPWPEKSSDV
jgi:septum formation protein